MDEDGRAAGAEEPVNGNRPFSRQKVYPYALRHTWAQDHADAGIPLEVLQDLLGHSKPGTTQGYYRMTHARRHEAMNRLSRLQLTNTGSLVVAGLRSLEREEDLRGQVGSVAVPFGTCVEPSNVKAGGHSCPYRMRCLGCSHFRTDPSYLPELGEYLTQLLVSRERLAAADSALEPWARDSAMPSTEEIDRVRHLIHRCESELESLTEEERAEINAYAAQVRTARAGTTQAVRLELLGIVRTDEPTLFAGRTSCGGCAHHNEFSTWPTREVVDIHSPMNDPARVHGSRSDRVVLIFSKSRSQFFGRLDNAQLRLK
ncbi:hypothetical protein AU252_17625 [Pseudarthrobacter sulfonivorans]|uniref:Tyr recombinase domain-containing protein n=2 Tax=Pseudarthrobacter sulfonivorans TaxID=121292 RepID=A0A0U3P0U0_9MICC|nr:hypothetical protein AU252_17625 [Pseudarthrobacter sulfonivorans]